jgi:hypothetical protein
MAVLKVVNVEAHSKLLCRDVQCLRSLIVGGGDTAIHAKWQ